MAKKKEANIQSSWPNKIILVNKSQQDRHNKPTRVIYVFFVLTFLATFYDSFGIGIRFFVICSTNFSFSFAGSLHAIPFGQDEPVRTCLGSQSEHRFRWKKASSLFIHQFHKSLTIKTGKSRLIKYSAGGFLLIFRDNLEIAWNNS